MIYTLLATAKLNDVDPRAWLADALARIADHPASCLDELLPWNWTRATAPAVAQPVSCKGGLTLAAISSVHTIARVAEMLDVGEEHLHDFSLSPGRTVEVACDRAGQVLQYGVALRYHSLDGPDRATLLEHSLIG